MLLVAPDFDEHPVIQFRIHDPDDPVDRNIQSLAARCTEDHWNEAAERSNHDWEDAGGLSG